MNDVQINHPQHYGGDSSYECIKVLENWLTPQEYLGFLRGNVIKYLCRCEKKENCICDLKKAECYLHILINFLEKYSEED